MIYNFSVKSPCSDNRMMSLLQLAAAASPPVVFLILMAAVRSSMTPITEEIKTIMKKYLQPLLFTIMIIALLSFGVTAGAWTINSVMSSTAVKENCNTVQIIVPDYDKTKDKNYDNEEDHIIISNSIFNRKLPKREIIDVVVIEMVLSYKVTTKLYFRIRPGGRGGNESSCGSANSSMDGNNSKGCESQSLMGEMKSGGIELVEAFPDFEMTYRECDQMWEGINKALGMLQ